MGFPIRNYHLASDTCKKQSQFEIQLLVAPLCFMINRNMFVIKKNYVSLGPHIAKVWKLHISTIKNDKMTGNAGRMVPHHQRIIGGISSPLRFSSTKSKRIHLQGTARYMSNPLRTLTCDGGNMAVGVIATTWRPRSGDPIRRCTHQHQEENKIR